MNTNKRVTTTASVSARLSKLNPNTQTPHEYDVSFGGGAVTQNELASAK